MYNYCTYGLNFSSEIHLKGCVPSYSTKIDFEIRLQKFDLPELEETNIHRKGIMAHSAMNGENDYYLHWENVASYRAVDGKQLFVNCYTDEQDVLELFTISEAVGLILLQRGYYTLHASSVKVGDEAWVFLGEPGAGKSTTSAAFVKAGCQILSDDLTAISFDDKGKPFVFPSYPHLKIWENTAVGLGYETNKLNAVVEGVNKYLLETVGEYDMNKVPLTRLFFLLKSGESREIKVSEFAVETLKHFPLSNQYLTPQLLSRLFHQSLQIAAGIKRGFMVRPDGFQALEAWVASHLSN